jgi:hypothetical protein
LAAFFCNLYDARVFPKAYWFKSTPYETPTGELLIQSPRIMHQDYSQVAPLLSFFFVEDFLISWEILKSNVVKLRVETQGFLKYLMRQIFAGLQVFASLPCKFTYIHHMGQWIASNDE